MKITIETEHRKVSIELPEDSTIYTLYEAFDTLAIGASYASFLVEEAYLSRAEEIEQLNKARERA